MRSVFVVLMLLFAGCAANPTPTPVPASLVPAGEREVHRFAARGMQTYQCKAHAVSGAVWTYVASELQLFDDRGEVVGHHTFPPPVWAAVDGSKFTGQVKARANAPQAGAGQWLLLSTRSTGAEGRFSKITSLQRVNTVGGVAPLSRCEAGNIGVAEKTPLAAEFVFFSK